MSLTEAALRYKSVGISVIPFATDKKVPDLEALGSSGNLNLVGQPSWRIFYRRLPTDHEIAVWFASGERNLGILTGRQQLLALDFDAQESYEDWFSTFREIASRTCIQKSRRGFHVFFRWAMVWTTRFRTGIGFRLLGMETSGGGSLKGAYDWLTAWPSIRDGRQYQWLPGQAPWETEILRIDRLAEIGIEPVKKIPQAYFTFVHRLLADPRGSVPLLLRWCRYRYDMARGTGAKYY